MATEPIRIPIRQVPKEITNVGPDALILVDDGVEMGKAKASNAVDKRAKAVAQQEIADLNLGTAAQANITDFATAAQGAKADTAIQPGDLATALDGKVDKVSGKGLSSEDYTSAEKLKLAGIASGAQVNTVTSVVGKTGAVTLAKADVGLGNVDNTSDANKPVSSATQTALNAKANSAVTITAGTGLTGGGTLAANRTIALNSASIASLALADSAIQAADLGDLATIDLPSSPAGDFLDDSGNWVTIPGGGDMLRATYDPQNIAANAFDRANHTGVMPLSGLDSSSSGAGVIGRSNASGDYVRLTLASAATANSVPYRGAGGVVKTGAPSANEDATTKLYVDTGLATKETLGEQAGINTQTGTAYTLALSDKGKVVEMNNGSANTLTIPANANVAFPVNTRIDVVQYGAGQTTIAGASGVVIYSADGNTKLNKQYSGATLYKRSTNGWVLIGDLVA